MRRLYLDSNQALTQVPSTIGNLLSLRELSLKACGLGALPSSVLNLDSLEMLDVGGNHMGNIPPGSLLWHWLNRNDPDWEQTQG